MSAATTSIEIADPKAYQQKILKLLGDRDPKMVLAETPSVLRRIVQSRSADAFQQRPFEGKWTPAEVIGHLIDAEWTYGFRIRMILAHNQPTLLGMDQEAWVRAQRYNDCNPVDLVNDFDALRQVNLRLWKAMGPADLQRVGKHAERGAESLDLMLRMNAGHDLSHIDQITRYLTAIPERIGDG